MIENEALLLWQLPFAMMLIDLFRQKACWKKQALS